ncbi:MAG TPA: hypothetical protein VHS96_18175 [Bacteroidia bacterium]|nr:hypothetical protein [Bacteroidia bacterium]
MRPLHFSIGLLLFCLSGLQLFAQNCSAYFPMKVGDFFETTCYDNKGKVTSVSSSSVVEAQKTIDGGLKVTVDIETKYAGIKKAVPSKQQYVCLNGELRVDLRTPLGLDQPEDSETAKHYLIYPSDLEVGMKLPDAELSYTYKDMNRHLDGSFDSERVSISITNHNRRVTGRESITTPVGTYSCLVIEEDFLSYDNRGGKISYQIKTWLAPGVGTLRTEITDNGKPFCSYVMTKSSLK